MIKLLLPLITALLLVGCKTNPPTDPNAITVSAGEIAIRIKIIQNSGLSVNKKVLLEDFANVSCNPCVTSNLIIENLTRVTYGPQKLVSIKFPTNFPSPNDPFYLANKDACNFRMIYYNILQAPTVIIDGVTKPVPTDSNSYKQAIGSRLNLQTNFLLEISKEEQSGGLLFNLNIHAKDTSSLNLSSLFLRFTLVESTIEFATPPGSNGETKFYDVMRSVFPTNDGFIMAEVKTFTGLGQVFRFENSLNSKWEIANLNAVVFIQNKITKEVLQAGSTFNN